MTITGWARSTWSTAFAEPTRSPCPCRGSAPRCPSRGGTRCSWRTSASQPGDFVTYYARVRDVARGRPPDGGAQRHLLPRGEAVRGGVRLGAEPGRRRQRQSFARRPRHGPEGHRRRDVEAGSPRRRRAIGPGRAGDRPRAGRAEGAGRPRRGADARTAPPPARGAGRRDRRRCGRPDDERRCGHGTREVGARRGEDRRGAAARDGGPESPPARAGRGQDAAR